MALSYTLRISSSRIFNIILVTFLLLAGHVSLGQTEEDVPEKRPVKYVEPKGFYAGFYVGSLFANAVTAEIYDGYGYDLNGKKNDFSNSFMRRRIVDDYGGRYGLPDLIAKELNVNPGEWNFDGSDMPVNLQYNIAIMVGLHSRYCLNKKDAVQFNVNATKLTVAGNFTITTTTTTQAMNTPANIQTFDISGSEERLMFQLGFQRILGDDEKLNFFIEGGPAITLARFNNNLIRIKNLEIDLTSYYNLPGYVNYRASNLTGIGLGAYAGLGINLSMSPKWTIQLVYSPSLERINIGEGAPLSLQHALGLRAYYNL